MTSMGSSALRCGSTQNTTIEINNKTSGSHGMGARRTGGLAMPGEARRSSVPTGPTD